MSAIDPRDFGALEADVRSLRDQLTATRSDLHQMSTDLRELKLLLAHVQGARWTLGALLTLGTILGGAITWTFQAIRN